MDKASLSEFLRTQANELWLPILRLEEEREKLREDHITHIDLTRAIAELYKTQSSLETKAQEIENV